MAGAALAVVAVACSFRYGWELTCDDAFISYRYADHLEGGQGLVFNPGEQVEGFSNFLWVLLLAASKAMGAHIQEAAQALSVVFGVALFCGVAMLTLKLTPTDLPDQGRQRLLAAFAVVVFAFDESVIFWLTSGLETTAYCACIVWALCAFEWSRGDTKVGLPRLLVLAALCVAAACFRPDGHILGVAMVALVLFRGLRKKAGWTKRGAALFVVFYVLPLCGYHLFRYSYFGDLLPNTWHARQGAAAPLFDGLRYLSQVAFSRGVPAALALAALTIPKGRAGGTLTVSLLLAAGITVAGGDWMAHQRLLLPIFAPLLAAAVASALALTQARSRPTALALLLLLPVALVCWPHDGSFGRLLAFRGADPLAAQEGTMVAAQRRAAQWVAERAAPGQLVAANHIGAFAFEARELEVLDMVGLTDRHIAQSPGQGLHRHFDLEYVVSKEPDWIILNSRERPVHGRYPGDYWPGETLLAESPFFRARCVQAHVESWQWTEHPESFVLVYQCTGPAMAGVTTGLRTKGWIY